MMVTAKRSAPASLTVSEMPSTATEPLTASMGASAAGTAISSRWQSPSGSIAAISPTASTWPNTRWPPSSSPSRSDRSRLTARPRASRRAWCAPGSRARPAPCGSGPPSPPRSGRCRHGRARRRGRARPAAGRWRSRARARPRISRTSATSPRWVTMPVNMRASSSPRDGLEHRQPVLLEQPLLDAPPAPGVGQPAGPPATGWPGGRRRRSAAARRTGRAGRPAPPAGRRWRARPRPRPAAA